MSFPLLIMVSIQRINSYIIDDQYQPIIEAIIIGITCTVNALMYIMMKRNKMTFQSSKSKSKARYQP